MRTTKPISTISFNTPEYLKLKLDELCRAKIISFYAFIQHKPEDDEGGKKEHIHVYIEPAKMLQTEDLKEELKEPDPSKPDKPRGCIKFNSSKFDPWYLYSVHDRRYLASISQSRRFHYRYEDIITSDPDTLNFMFHSIDMLALSPYSDMEDAVSQGLTFDEYFMTGRVPIAQIKQFSDAFGLIVSNHTKRNGHKNHPMSEDEDDTKSPVTVDPRTGEVIPPDELPW